MSIKRGMIESNSTLAVPETPGRPVLLRDALLFNQLELMNSIGDVNIWYQNASREASYNHTHSKDNPLDKQPKPKFNSDNANVLSWATT